MISDGGVTFPPHVGRRYKESRLKLLILGESYYDWPNRPNKLDEVTKVAVGDGGSRFHRAIRVLLRGPEDFWERVAFYNYVQCFVGSRPRQRPTAQMWKGSHGAFGKTLKCLQPDRILVIGKTTWLEMAGNVEDYLGCKTIVESRFKLGPSFSWNIPSVAKCAYWYPTVASRFALAAPIYHPAYPRGFYSNESEEVAEELMDTRWISPD